MARYRHGDRPSLTELIERNSDLAEQIRDLFPTLVMMEEARVRASDPGGGVVHKEIPGKPARVGEYRILREVGRGGMGIVYEAEQESLGRHVALKILPTHALLDSRQLQRFQREARAAARLHHTNIVPVFGVGEYEGLNYYVMQFIQGLGLDQVLVELKRLRKSVVPAGVVTRQDSDNGEAVVSAVELAEGLASGHFKIQSDPADRETTDSSVANAGVYPQASALVSDVHLPGQDRDSSLSDSGREYWFGVARVGVQVAEALAYANSQGVVHRDIKPSNLLLDTRGTVWVTDFGLAKDTPPGDSRDGVVRADLTRTGDVVGTLRYLAPERLKGHSDQRSDIYSLGATLYEMLTLRPPFEESDRNVLVRRLLHDEPPRPRSRDPAVPLDLETIVVKAMAKEPADRYRSAADLAEDLRCFLADRPIRARRATAWERAWRLCRRNPVITGLSAAVVLLLAALVAGTLVAGWIRAERDRALTNLARAEQAERRAQNSLERAQVAERDAQIRAHLTQAIVDRKRGAVGHRVRSLGEVEQAIALDPTPEMRHELRNELIATLARTDVVPSRVWHSPHAMLDVDPQFTKYARGTRDGIISVRRMADDQELLRLQRPPGPDTRARLKFSPDGAYLASFTFDHHMMVWRVDDGELVLDDVGCRWEHSFDFTPDSQAIVTGHDREVLVHDLVTTEVKSRWSVEFAPWCVSCGPRNDWVAVSPEGQNGMQILQVFCWSTRKLVAECPAGDWVFDVAWLPAGKALAFGCGDLNIYLWEVGPAKPYRQLIGSLAGGIRVEFSHDGALLASSSWGREFILWEPTTGEMLCSAPSAMNCLRFSPDDQQIALFADGSQIGTYQVIRSKIFRHFLRTDRDSGDLLLNAAFSPDGRFMITGTKKGLSAYEFPSGEERGFAPVGRTYFLRFDGFGHLWTVANGLYRWPVHNSGDATGHLAIGPPERLAVRTPNEFDISHDGKVLAVAQYDGATVIHADDTEQPIKLGPHEDCRYVSVSGDGKWVATGSHWGSKVKVWDAAAGSLVATLPIESSSWVRFSPDGKWLATTGARNLWKVGSWEAGPNVDGHLACFSEDGRLMAVDDLAGSVHLRDPSTAHEFARLEHPNGYGAERYVFTPDGTELVAVGTGKPSSFAWDLRGIREELAARNLDWDLPPYPPRMPHTANEPLEVKWISSETEKQSRKELAAARIARCREAHDANPDDATACNELAWALLIAPKSLRSVEEAVVLATNALEIRPEDANFRNTLGVAFYRAGRYREAVNSLAANLPLQEEDGLPFDLYFLAMSHFQLGEQDRAREVLIWANRWSETRIDDRPHSEEERDQLATIRQEAEQLILSP